MLLALSSRSAARLVADRSPLDATVAVCASTSRAGDAIHLAMALGMIPMAVPLGVPPPVLVVFFAAMTALMAAGWLRGATLRRLAARRGGPVPCRPAHALESHHVIISLTMILMAWQMAAGPTMDGMPNRAAGMADGMPVMPGMAAVTGVTTASHAPTISTLALVYTWAAAIVLGCGLVRAASARPVPSGAVALLAAPLTVYTCELAMTVVMGLMLLG